MLNLRKTISIFILGYIGQWILVQNETFIISFTFSQNLSHFLRWGININNAIVAFTIWIFIANYFYKHLFISKDIQGHHAEKIILVSQHDLNSEAIERNKRNIPIIIVIVGLSFFLCGLLIYMKYLKQNWPIAGLVYLSSLMSVVLASLLSSRIRLSKRISQYAKEIIPVLIICLLSILIMGYNLRFPKELVSDEAAPWGTVRTILKRNFPKDIFSYDYYTYPSLNAFLHAWILTVFRLDNGGIAGWRFPSVIIGMIIVIGTYFLGYSMFSRRVGLFGALIALGNPFLMILSRISFPTNQSIIPVLFTVLFIYLAVKKENFFYTCLAGIFSGFGFYVFPAGKIAIAIGTIYLILVLLKTKAYKKKIISLVFFYIFSFFITAGPVIADGVYINTNSATLKLYEDISLRTDFIKNVYPEITDKKLTEFFPLIKPNNTFNIFIHPLAILLLLRNLIVTFFAYFHPGISGGLIFSSSLTGYEWGFLVFSGLYIMFRKYIHRTDYEKYSLLIIWFTLSMIIFGSIWGVATFWRMQPVIPLLSILVGLLFSKLYDQIRAVQTRITAIIIISFLIAFLLGSNLTRYFHSMHISLPESEEFKWKLAQLVNDAQANEMIYYIYDNKRGIQTGSGILFNLFHLQESRYDGITTDTLDEKILKSDRNKKLTFIYEDKEENISEILNRYYGQKGDTKAIYSSRIPDRVLYYLYEVN